MDCSYGLHLVVLGGWRGGGNSFSRKSFSMENVFWKKIIFHIPFSVVWYKIDDFLQNKEKYQLSNLSGKKYQLNS